MSPFSLNFGLGRPKILNQVSTLNKDFSEMRTFQPKLLKPRCDICLKTPNPEGTIDMHDSNKHTSTTVSSVVGDGVRQKQAHCVITRMNPRGRFAPKSLTALPYQYRTPACIYAASIICSIHTACECARRVQLQLRESEGSKGRGPRSGMRLGGGLGKVACTERRKVTKCWLDEWDERQTFSEPIWASGDAWDPF